MTADACEYLESDGARLAYRRSRGAAGRAGLVWLGGFHSDMLGEKATALHRAAEREGRDYLRFDYLGHGESGGAFADGTVGRWRADALAMIDQLTDGPIVLVGSSMGGWMALLAALARPERVKGLVLLAPAPDFTERLMWDGFDDAVRQEIMETGQWTRPSPYDPEGYPITRTLIEEGRNWLLLDAQIDIEIPVRVLHGGFDEDVPWKHSFEMMRRLKTKDVEWTMIQDGDHRLSRPEDIAQMVGTALVLCDQVDAASDCRQAARPSR